ncbi:hypothetical protein [Hymenobacter negativus]|uniref:Uncharacterized protein n=1 Tax=Hymenobacter negativus TaxID=2795026 RepID=A0ABS0Q1V1_9BACT|nr:hypothetical protein [Hymenobacter negativus]MBH8556618.1 hypothetical protein [Hymenobacter negativus]
MLKNFQRYFRFYLASVLFGLLLAGIRWQTAPLGANELNTEPASTSAPAARPVHVASHSVAFR